MHIVPPTGPIRAFSAFFARIVPLSGPLCTLRAPFRAARTAKGCRRGCGQNLAIVCIAPAQEDALPGQEDSLPGQEDALPGWTWSTYRGCTRSTRYGSEGSLGPYRWTWSGHSKWTRSRQSSAQGGPGPIEEEPVRQGAGGGGYSSVTICSRGLRSVCRLVGSPVCAAGWPMASKP